MFRTPPLRACLFLSGLPLLSSPAGAAVTIEVPVGEVLRMDSLGSGGNPPRVDGGRVIANLQPASAVEWKVVAPSDGLYSVMLRMGQWEHTSTILSIETRPYTETDAPYATGYASPDTRDYGRTAGQGIYHPIGHLEDALGRPITVPLRKGANVVGIRNVSGRHHPARSYPVSSGDRYPRDWGVFASNLHIAAVTLTRVGDLPALGTITGKVTGNLPAGVAVRRSIVTANPAGESPAEPSNFWKWGWYTYTKDDGTFSLQAPQGAQEVKAGRPSSYEVQGSAVQAVTVPATGSATANLTLTSLFKDDGTGALTASVQAEYFDSRTGDLGLLALDGENGYKMGWADPGDSTTMIVDAPKAGWYKVASSYTNGGEPGRTRVTIGGKSLEVDQPPHGWGEVTMVEYPGRLYMDKGPNAVIQTLLSGNSDQDAIHLTLVPDAP